MNISIDEKTVNELVEKRINELVDKEFGEYIDDLVEKRLDTIARRMADTSNARLDLMKRTIEQTVRTEVRARLDEMNFFTEEKLTELSKEVATALSFKLSCDITDILASRLSHDDDDNYDED